MKHATPKLQVVVKRLSSMTPQEIAPDEYEFYVPSYYLSSTPGGAHGVSYINRFPRWVGKGNLSVKNLVEDGRLPRMDEDIREMVTDALDKGDV